MPQTSTSHPVALDPQVEEDLRAYLEGLERWVGLSRHDGVLHKVQEALARLLDLVNSSRDRDRRYFVATLARAIYVLPIVLISALIPGFYAFLPLATLYLVSTVIGVVLTSRKFFPAAVFYWLALTDIYAVGVGVHLTGSLTTPAVVFYPIMAILGATFLGLRTGLFFAATCCASYTGLVVLEGLGIIPYSPMLGVAFPYEWVHGIPAYPVVVVFVAHFITFGGALIAGLITYELHLRSRNAEGAVKTKNELLSICSHDLKNLLVVTGGYAELLVCSLDDANADAREQAQQIHIVNQQMLELIRNILDAARLDTGSISFEPGPVALSAVVREVAKTQNPNAALRGVRLQLAAPGSLLLRGELPKLVQVFTNLVQNAISHTPEGGLVSLELEDTTSGTARIVVRDTGPGMAPETPDIIFDPTALARQRHRQNRSLGLSLSTGLGMSIVRRFVEMHGGSVSIESKVGEGTSVCVELPLETTPENPHVEEIAAALLGVAT